MRKLNNINQHSVFTWCVIYKAFHLTKTCSSIQSSQSRNPKAKLDQRLATLATLSSSPPPAHIQQIQGTSRYEAPNDRKTSVPHGSGSPSHDVMESMCSKICMCLHYLGKQPDHLQGSQYVFVQHKMGCPEPWCDGVVTDYDLSINDPG